MAESNSQETNNKNISLQTVIVVLAFYALIIGMLYLSAFWSSFSINPFEHASVRDIAVTAFYPLVWMILMGILFVLIFEMFTGKFVNDFVIFDHKDIRRFVLIGFAISGLSIIVPFILLGSPFQWILAGTFGLPIGIIINEIPFLNYFWPSDRIRMHLIVLLCMFPIIAIAFGSMNAINIQKRKDGILVDFTGSKDLYSIVGTKQYKYLGRLGDRFFLISVGNNDVISLSLDEANILVFHVNNQQ